MNRRFLWTLVAVVVAALVAAGCGEDNGGDGTSTSGDGGGFGGTLVIGETVPLTGGLADFGKAAVIAGDIAIEQINAAQEEAGLDGEVTIEQADDETTEDGAKAAAETLVRDKDVSCIAGDWASGATKAVANSVTVDERIPLISPASTASDITDLDDDGLVFRVAPSDLLQAEVLAQEVADDLGGSGTVSVGAINNDYGSAFAAAFKPAGEAAGLTVNDAVLYDPEGTQFDSEAAQIVEGNPDAFVFVDYPDQGWPKMAPALARTGDWSAAESWGADGLRSETLPQDLGRPLTEGMRGTAPVSVDSDAAVAFQRLWDEAAQGERQTYDAQNFDAVMLCYLGAVAADSTDGSHIAEKLQEVSSPPGLRVTVDNLAEGIEALRDGEDIDYDGASGPINFDDNGDPTAAQYEIWQYKGAKLTSLSKVPFGLDDGEDGASTTGETTGDTEGETETTE